MFVRSAETLTSLKFGLASFFGTLNSDAIKQIDDNLKIIISAATRAISELQDYSWTNLLSVFSQDPLLEPIGEEEVRYDKLIKDYGTSWFKFDGSPDPSVVNEVEVWINNFIRDEDIINSTGIDKNLLAQIVAATGARIDSFETFFVKREYHEQTVFEIGVLRYPDLENPYFKVYRIKLSAWSYCSRIVFSQDDKNGIVGEFSVKCYKPRDSAIAGLTQVTILKAIKMAEDLLA